MRGVTRKSAHSVRITNICIPSLLSIGFLRREPRRCTVPKQMPVASQLGQPVLEKAWRHTETDPAAGVPLSWPGLLCDPIRWGLFLLSISVS